MGIKVLMHFRFNNLLEKLLDAVPDSLLFEVTRHRIAVPGLPSAARGLKIVQISDLHVDVWNRGVLERAIHRVNALKPDILVCTGDTIANGRRYIGDLTDMLKRFDARYGKFACLGNHDYSDGGGSIHVRRGLKQAGFDVLVNDSVPVRLPGGQTLHVAGADDLIMGRQCLRKTSRQWRGDSPVILLNHNPENFDAVSRFDPALTLSGHTHGGQILMPDGLRRRLLASPYVAGLYREGNSPLYVNRGLGSAVFVHHTAKGRRITIPTPRLAVRPEISVFVLADEKGDLQPAKPETSTPAIISA